jgi:hypothetical protein
MASPLESVQRCGGRHLAPAPVSAMGDSSSGSHAARQSFVYRMIARNVKCAGAV